MADITPKKVIVDTDPGIDDAMAIFFALQSPELDVIGLTTTYGNVRTTMATANALHLLDFAGREDIPVSQGLTTSLRGAMKERIADFVHGNDGLGNTNPAPSKRKAMQTFGPDFLIQKVNESPGEITIVALGPLTNLAKAVETDPTFPKKVGQIVILGGAFSVNGNVNPAAEANVFGDPEAADIVFTCGADILVVGINITHQVFWTGEDLEDLGRSSSKYGKYLYAASHFYAAYHRAAYDINAIYLHDPATMVAAVDPSLMTYAEGVVRVQQDGIMRGLTLFNNTKKTMFYRASQHNGLSQTPFYLPRFDATRVAGTGIYIIRWQGATEWCNKPTVKVAVTVDSDRIAALLKERLMAPQIRHVPSQASSCVK